MYPELLLFGVGAFGIWLGAEIAVRNAQSLAKSLHISDAFIGMTILSIGTSLPEIFMHIVASIDILKGVDASGIAVGTNIGSNIIQITLITGLVGLFMVIKSEKKILRFDYVIMLLSILFLWLLSLNGKISRIEGIILSTAYIIFLIYLTKDEKIIQKVSHNHRGSHTILYSTHILIGVIFLIVCADLVIDNALILSKLFGISGTFIGTVIVGVATALPELTTAMVGVMRGASGISLGTLIGSNITNPMLALGIGAIISGYQINNVLLWFDLPFWFFVSLVGYFFFRAKMTLLKSEAAVLVFFYVIYVAIKFSWFMA